RGYRPPSQSAKCGAHCRGPPPDTNPRGAETPFPRTLQRRSADGCSRAPRREDPSALCPTSPLLGKTWADLYVGPAFRAVPDLQHEGHDHDHEDDQHRDGAADEQERVLVALALLGPTVLGGLLAVLPRLAVLLRGLAVGLLLPVLLVLLLA